MSNKYDTEFNAQQRHADYIRKAVDALQGAPVPTEGRSDLAAPSDEPFSDFWDDAKVADQPEDAALSKAIDDIVFRCFAQGQYWGTEHHVISDILTNEDLAALAPATLKRLKARQSELTQKPAKETEGQQQISCPCLTCSGFCGCGIAGHHV